MNITKIKWYLITQMCRFMYGSVGKHSYLGKAIYVQRRRNLHIGNNVRIYPGMRAEMTCSDATVVIRDNVSIGQNFHIVSYKGALIIGQDTTISGNVFISNVDHSYCEICKNVLSQEMLYKETLINENCFIGYGAVILPGTKLGKQCIVGANSVVRGEFPDYCVIAGNPATIVKRYDFNICKWIKAEMNDG